MTATPMPIGTLTFMMADLETSDSTGRQAPLPAEVARNWAEHGGHVFQPAEAVVAAVFRDPLAALGAAASAQVALRAGTLVSPAAPVLRAAIHTGLAEVADGAYVGAALARTGYLLAAAHAGQTLVSSATRELVRDNLPPGQSLRDLGPHRLPDLLRPANIFQLVGPGQPASSHSLRSLDAWPHNLPVQTTSFVGREHELAEAEAALGQMRLLTLTGAEGNGKTRLALQVAAGHLAGQTDGAWLVELGGLAQPDLLPQAIAAALGLREQAGEAPLATLVAWLQARRLVLVLDDGRAVHEAVAAIAAAILDACPDVRLIATDLAPLGIPGEAVLVVPALTLPRRPAPAGAPPPALSQYDAVRLFLERAGTVLPGLNASNDNLPAIAHVCHRVGGVPLAIEMAAAQVGRWGEAGLAERLDAWFQRLAAGQPDLLSRGQVLRATIDWSAALLDPMDARLLHRLAVFAGPFDTAMATAVGADDGDDAMAAAGADDVLPAAAVPAGLARLVAAALVVPLADGSQHRLLDPIRRNALEGLEAAGQGAAARDRHLAWCLDFSRVLGEGPYHPPPDAAALARVEAHHDDLRAALEWGLADARAAWDGVDLAGRLRCFWIARGHFREGRAVLTRAVQKARAGAPPQLQAMAGVGLGEMLWRLGDDAQAVACYEGVLPLYRQAGDRHGEAWALNDLGYVLCNQGDVHAAERLLEASLAIKRELAPAWDTAVTLSNLGEVARARGDLVLAAARYQESLDLVRGPDGIEQSPLILLPLLNLGYVRLRTGDTPAAAAHLREYLALAGRAQEPVPVAAALAGLAGVAAQSDQPVRAARLSGAAEGILVEVGAQLDRTDREDAAALVARARAMLTPKAWARAADEGRAMAFAEAVAYGLREDDVSNA